MVGNKSKLAVTGMSGMIGDRFSELYGHKYDFTNLDLTQDVDITDKKSVDKMIKETEAEQILHLAAFTDVNAANKQKGDKKGSAYMVNVVGTQNIVDAAKKYNKYLIHISTDFVFGGDRNKPYNEDNQPDPIEWYGESHG